MDYWEGAKTLPKTAKRQPVDAGIHQRIYRTRLGEKAWLMCDLNEYVGRQTKKEHDCKLSFYSLQSSALPCHPAKALLIYSL